MVVTRALLVCLSHACLGQMLEIDRDAEFLIEWPEKVQILHTRYDHVLTDPS